MYNELPTGGNDGVVILVFRETQVLKNRRKVDSVRRVAITMKECGGIVDLGTQPIGKDLGPACDVDPLPVRACGGENMGPRAILVGGG